uniref:Aspartyl/asparaginy/proline hydroxylase domain-containing protein n=1 Tax=Arcella intermedia TaxID=1963864 RepID=A0A6B2L5B1_9EUKA
MFDVTSRPTFRNVPNWIRELRRLCNNIPIVVVGNKIDDPLNHKMLTSNYLEKNNITSYPVSVYCNYNIGKPVAYLLSSLCGPLEVCECLSKVGPPMKQQFEVPNYNHLGLIKSSRKESIDMRKPDLPIQFNYTLHGKMIIRRLNDLSSPLLNNFIKSEHYFLQGHPTPDLKDKTSSAPMITIQPLYHPITIQKEIVENMRELVLQALANPNVQVEKVYFSPIENWELIYLIKEGIPQETTIFQDSTTFLSHFSYPTYLNKLRHAHFIILPPNNRIPSHCGPSHIKFKAMIPISNNGHLWIHLGNQPKEWKEGESILLPPFVFQVTNPTAKHAVILVLHF